MPNPVLANLSDVLIVLDEDGRSYTTQHTLASDGALLVLDLPGSIIPQSVHFMGPDKATFEHAYSQKPDRVAIWSGAALVRYNYQYSDAVSQTGRGEFALSTPSIPSNVSVENSSVTSSDITWVLPNSFEVVSYTQTDKETGTWIVDGNTLTYRQFSKHPVMLRIDYRRVTPRTDEKTDLCANGFAKTDDCAEDNDDDGVPDYRDVCLDSEDAAVSGFGCIEASPLILSEINFASGYAYLNVKARKVLDRLAYGLQHNSDRYYEVGAHTDSQGKADRNKQLSQKRAAAVRHYLLLRGVDPNQIRATGYGENYPIKDNAEESGRRQNRRIELTALE